MTQTNSTPMPEQMVVKSDMDLEQRQANKHASRLKSSLLSNTDYGNRIVDALKRHQKRETLIGDIAEYKKRRDNLLNAQKKAVEEYAEYPELQGQIIKAYAEFNEALKNKDLKRIDRASQKYQEEMDAVTALQKDVADFGEKFREARSEVRQSRVDSILAVAALEEEAKELQERVNDFKVTSGPQMASMLDKSKKLMTIYVDSYDDNFRLDHLYATVKKDATDTSNKVGAEVAKMAQKLSVGTDTGWDELKEALGKAKEDPRFGTLQERLAHLRKTVGDVKETATKTGQTAVSQAETVQADVARKAAAVEEKAKTVAKDVTQSADVARQVAEAEARKRLAQMARLFKNRL